MPSSVVISGIVELGLILVTTVLLAQPRIFFRTVPSRVQLMVRWGGVLLLCLTFCWSVVCGIILSMNNLALRI